MKLNFFNRNVVFCGKFKPFIFLLRLHCKYKDAWCLYLLMEACEGGDLWILLRERYIQSQYLSVHTDICIQIILKGLSLVIGKITTDFYPE